MLNPNYGVAVALFFDMKADPYYLIRIGFRVVE